MHLISLKSFSSKWVLNNVCRYVVYGTSKNLHIITELNYHIFPNIRQACIFSPKIYRKIQNTYVRRKKLMFKHVTMREKNVTKQVKWTFPPIICCSVHANIKYFISTMTHQTSNNNNFENKTNHLHKMNNFFKINFFHKFYEI